MGIPAKNCDQREKEEEEKSMRKGKSEDPGKKEGGEEECSVNTYAGACSLKSTCYKRGRRAQFQSPGPLLQLFKPPP